MKKWHLVIDIEKCNGCNNCFIACKDEYVGNDFHGYSLQQPAHGQHWINIMMNVRGQFPIVDVAYLPKPCMHCDNAPCIQVADNNAVYKRRDGIVIINTDRALGQKKIATACPYGAIYWNEEKQIPQKCTFCAHLLDRGWKEPRCVQACPTGALTVLFMDDNKIPSIIEAEKLEVYQPQYKTKPLVYYKNLYRYISCFIAGSVAIVKDGRTECAEGAEVILYRDSNNIANKVNTDNYGDFKFDKLEENSGKYIVEINYPGYGKKSIEVYLKTSLNIGTIILS